MSTKIDTTKYLVEMQRQNTISQPAKMEDRVSIFDENSDEKTDKNNTKTKKILLGVGIGTAIAATVGVGLFIANVRKPGTMSNNLAHKLLNNTSIGQKLKSGIEYAKEAHDIPMEKVQSEGNGLLEKLFERLFNNGEEIAKETIGDTAFLTEAKDYVKDRITGNVELISEMGKGKLSDKIKGTIELTGVGPTKIAQVISGDRDIMAKIEMLSPDLATAISSTRSECSFSRTLEEAKDVVDTLFKGKGYVLEKEIGAGTIGATYLARIPGDKKVIIKLIKKGVTKESLEREHKIIDDIITKLGGESKDVKSIKSYLMSLYEDWMKELDFTRSLENSKLLSDGAKRYSVAKVLNVAENGQALVMDLAEGIKMDNLMKILKDYKANPKEFFTKYSELIEAYPWLGNPEKVLKELPSSLLKAFDEQFLFVKKGAKSIMHGDPHAGNFFITFNSSTGKLIPNFIDTDNCVMRTSKQIQQDLSFFVNYFVGNSRKVAEYFVNQCDCQTADKKKLIQYVAKDIKAFIFDKKGNITDVGMVESNIKTILKKYGLEISSENATSMKAQLQYLTSVREAGHLAGQSFDILTIIKDVPRAVFGMIANGVNPFGCISDAVKYTIHNRYKSFCNLLQFFIKTPNVC